MLRMKEKIDEIAYSVLSEPKYFTWNIISKMFHTLFNVSIWQCLVGMFFGIEMHPRTKYVTLFEGNVRNNTEYLLIWNAIASSANE